MTRRNPAHTIAIKHQYQVCYRLRSRHGFSARFIPGSVIAEELNLLEGCREFNVILPLYIGDEVLCVSWVELNRTVYRNGMYLSNQSDDNKKKFVKIKHVLIVHAQTIAFLCLKVNIVTYSSHLQSFEIQDTDCWTYIIQDDLVDYLPLNKQMMPNNKYYVALM
ncbi:hypothetical protein PV328_012271 [Microctonus aethiopoides]|uniref:Uncharacterized protein n=1 Tax=Microctonus aethiopoides TaxID=144406 RepID=A0AA39FGQ0_9HYME|nr:hypothetical protein PV328_012271 [Microctonus aethiopoides]